MTADAIAEILALAKNDERYERWRGVDQPTPLDATGQLPPFPTGTLPAPVAAMVGAVAEFTQTDPAMAGTSALAMIGAAACGRVEVEVRPGWREVLAFYSATVASPGERKSAVQGVMSAPLVDAEAVLAERGVAARREAETTQQVAQRFAEGAKAAAGRADGAERDSLLAAAIAATEQAAAVTVPAVPRLIADDVTPEAAGSLLAEQGGRLAIVSAEGGIFDTIAGRYSNNVPAMDVWLKGHAGDQLRVDRKGRPPEYVKRPALTLALMIQPAVLEAIARNEAFRGRGLLARFVYALPPSKVGRRTIGAPSVPDDVAEAYGRTLKTLALTVADWHDPAILTLTPAAGHRVLDFERVIEPQLGPGGELQHIADWGSKLVGATLRIAALLHLADHPEMGWRRPIEEATVARAVALAGYYKAHAVRAFDAMQTDPAKADARALIDVIRRLNRDTVTRRDLFTAASRSRFPKVDALDCGIRVLIDHDYLEALPQPETPGPGRKPSPSWAVHPSVLTAVSAVSAESGPVRQSADTAVSAARTSNPKGAAS